jgi:acyl-CoA synthetase (AMP-forming)/AMP-acid ligase II
MPPIDEITANFASHLCYMAHVQPHALAVLFPEGRDARGRVAHTHYTFLQLDAESDHIAQALSALGIGPGVRTVFMVKPSLDFLAFAFALFKVGAVLVGMDPGIGPKNIGKCLAEVRPTAFIGVPLAHLLRRLMGWSRETIRINVVAGSRNWTIDRFMPGAAEPSRVSRGLPADVGLEAPAAIVFTSGSTGVPKGVVYTHGTFHEQVRALQQTYGIERGEIDLTTFPYFSFFMLAMGVTTIIADMDFLRPARANPQRIAEAIDGFGVAHMFGSPALLNALGRWGGRNGVKLPSLKRVISAGAPVGVDVIRRITQMLEPGVQVFTPYGATEALPVTSIGSEEILADTYRATEEGQGVCVGRPCGDIEVRIIRITDEAIEKWSEDLCLNEGEIGEIVVRGKGVTREYYNRRESNRLAKIPDSNNGIFHRMGDLGYMDGKGRLWFCGRKSQRVITDSGIYFTVPCEAVFNTHDSVFRSALVPIVIAGKTNPALCVQLERKVNGSDRKRIREELLQIGAKHRHTRAIKKILFCSDFPVDPRHNAKIIREKLAVLAQRRLT